jgi:hypothetical protein
MIPGELAHYWNFDLALSNDSLSGDKCYRCKHCHMWTDNPKEALKTICPKKERRSNRRRKYADRRKPNDDMLIYAYALMEVPVATSAS